MQRACPQRNWISGKHESTRIDSNLHESREQIRVDSSENQSKCILPQMKRDGPSAAEPQPRRRKGAKTQRRKKSGLFSRFLCVFESLRLRGCGSAARASKQFVR